MIINNTTEADVDTLASQIERMSRDVGKYIKNCNVYFLKIIFTLVIFQIVFYYFYLKDGYSTLTIELTIIFVMKKYPFLLYTVGDILNLKSRIIHKYIIIYVFHKFIATYIVVIFYLYEIFDDLPIWRIILYFQNIFMVCLQFCILSKAL